MHIELSTSTKNQVAQFLLERCTNGKPNHGVLVEAAARFNIDRSTVRRIWKSAWQQMAEGLPIHLISKKAGVRGKRLHFDIEVMKTIDFAKRGTIRGLAKQMKVSKSTVHRWKKIGLIRAHSNAIKPALTPSNKLERLKYSLRPLVYDAEQQSVMFKPMDNIVHIDEKWFYMTKSTKRYYVYAGEEPPHRTIQSKSHIPKVMFMCAVSRPIFGSDGEVLFDGKIGMWPFTYTEPAKRNSKNRARGTLVTKRSESITRPVVKQMLIDKILPAIKAKWPANACKDIIIQQDNAPPHITNEDPEFRAAASADGFNIVLAFQPPNSPDTNINDLGWFRSIQSIKTEKSAYTFDQLIVAVDSSFNELKAATLNKIFLTWQSCLIEILKKRGHNNYAIPHLKKDSLIRQGLLPRHLKVDEELVRDCISYMFEAQASTKGLDDLMAGLRIGMV